jgi:hypothetical protein
VTELISKRLGMHLNEAKAVMTFVDAISEKTLNRTMLGSPKLQFCF